MPVVLATREAKPKESLEKSSRPASISSQKKKKKSKCQSIFYNEVTENVTQCNSDLNSTFSSTFS
jgi:hypothetical protein